MPISLELMPLEERTPEPPPPKTIVVRYGYLKEIGEFPSDVTAKIGCGTKLVVRTQRGTEIAEMLTTTCGNGGCGKSITRETMLQYIENSGGRDYPFTDQGRILRVATVQDLAEQSKLDEQRKKHIDLAREHVAKHNMELKIVDVEYLLGGERVLFYFTSEHRIDFRGLVRDLAHELRTRIELRQVGARDEARITADYEKCGQHCCCKQFLKVLTPISMRSAKVQKATLDPTKISGRCGRLMCCLRYEDQTYEELRKKLPKRNTRVKTEKGDAWVVDGQILTQLVLTQFDDGSREAIPLEKILAFDQPKPTFADGRVMQSPNDRPPEMQMAPRGGISNRGPGGPQTGPGAPQARGPGGPLPARGPGGPPPAGGPPRGPRPPQQPRPQQQGQAGPGGPTTQGIPPARPGPLTPPPARQGPAQPGQPMEMAGGLRIRPLPGKPAAGPGGDPLAKSGPTGGDLNTGSDIDDLIADAMDSAPLAPKPPARPAMGFQPPRPHVSAPEPAPAAEAIVPPAEASASPAPTTEPITTPGFQPGNAGSTPMGPIPFPPQNAPAPIPNSTQEPPAGGTPT